MIQKSKFGFIQFNKIFILLENQGIEHHYPDVVSVADIDPEGRVDDSLVKILKPKFSQNFKEEFWSRL